MKTNETTNRPVDRRTLLSTLWIFLSLNYIYCDHLGIMEPEVIRGLLNGQVGTIAVTQGFLLSAAVLLEIPFLMVVLSRVLGYRANRWVNIGAGALMAAVQVATMGMGTAPTAVYLFYSAVEIACNLLIVWLAWRWRSPEPSPNLTAAVPLESSAKA